MRFSANIRGALTVGLASMRANLVPMGILWAMAGVLVVGYYCLSEVRSVLDVLGRFQEVYGVWAGFVSQFVFCGVIPCVFRLSVAGVKTERPVLKSLLQSLWCGCWGVVYVGFYAL